MTENGPWIWQCDLDERFQGPSGVKSLIGVGSREKEKKRIRNRFKKTFSGSFIARRSPKMGYVV